MLIRRKEKRFQYRRWSKDQNLGKKKKEKVAAKEGTMTTIHSVFIAGEEKKKRL